MALTRLTEPTGVISGVVNAFAVTDVKWTDVTEMTGIADMVGVVSERIQSWMSGVASGMVDIAADILGLLMVNKPGDLSGMAYVAVVIRKG